MDRYSQFYRVTIRYGVGLESSKVEAREIQAFNPLGAIHEALAGTTIVSIRAVTVKKLRDASDEETARLVRLIEG